MSLSLCPQVENVVHIPKNIFKTKPISNSCKTKKKKKKKKEKKRVSKNLQYQAFFSQY